MVDLIIMGTTEKFSSNEQVPQNMTIGQIRHHQIMMDSGDEQQMKLHIL